MKKEERNGQKLLFDLPPAWTEQWKGMPSYQHKDLESWRSIIVHFRNEADLRRFSDAINQRVTPNIPSIWYPQAEIEHYADKSWRAGISAIPRYPVYIISKGRWKSRMTSKALEEMRIPYRIVVEPQEFDNYAAVIARERILTLPFSNLGQGSIPARNWVWEHAISEGSVRHWILDDNINGFFRFHNNTKYPVADGAIFCAAEDFVDRYENIALSGFQYFMFVPRKRDRIAPLTVNTRIYSCILIKNDIPFRWRGRYNEDTDLSIRVLKAGYCTVLFNAFLAAKAVTMTMKGGNTDELYEGDGRLRMAESLYQQHPDIVTIVKKFGRAQHQVNYRGFRRNKLVLRPDAALQPPADDYGMNLYGHYE